MTHLRDAAVEAATKALLVKRWGRDRDFAEHRNHDYRAGCAICDRDIDRIVPLALDAADAALRDIADPSDYRTGRKLGRTIYRDDNLIGVMDTPELGALVVAALNAYTEPEENPDAR